MVPMQPKAMSLPPAPNFHATHWKHRAPWQLSWHALDTAFGTGDAFLNTLNAWRSDSHRPAKLLVTSFASEAPDALHAELTSTCYGLLPGVHRILFDAACVQLTLYIGAPTLMARELDICANSICVQTFHDWPIKTIVRLCQRGTAVHWKESTSERLLELQSGGIQLSSSNDLGQYQPAWTPQTSMRSSASASDKAHQQRQVVVVGAGLAGSAVAYSLAQRGWQVKVLDRGPGLGAGASGLPAGIFATHVSPDNNVLSRITRDGVRATVQRAAALLQKGLDWDISHLMEHRYAGKRQLPTGNLWPKAGHEWSTHASAHQQKASGLLVENPALWHPLAGWIQTQALAKAQLGWHGIEVMYNACIDRLVRQNDAWHLMDSKGHTLAQASHVVLANAHDCESLLQSMETTLPEERHPRPHLPATALRGQVTFGPMSLLSHALRQKLPSFPVNGHGSFIGHLKDFEKPDSEAFWIVGSSFQRNDIDTLTRQEDQVSNLIQWAELMPALRDEILSGVQLSQASSWSAIRSALPDRVPAVGGFQHPEFEGISVCTGMGARGLSWSVLCGELLAAQLNQEPLPMATSLAKRMAASRFG